MIDVGHLEDATEPLSTSDIYQPAGKLLPHAFDELLAYLCPLVAYYVRVEGLSKQEATNLASQTLGLLVE